MAVAARRKTVVVDVGGVKVAAIIRLSCSR